MPVPHAAPEAPVMQMLADHLPLTLLVDLAEPDGPSASDILRNEPADTSWVPAVVDGQPPHSCG